MYFSRIVEFVLMTLHFLAFTKLLINSNTTLQCTEYLWYDCALR
jgi:hypothetical protein